MTFKSAMDGSGFSSNKFSIRKLEDKNDTRTYRFYRNIALKSKETAQNCYAIRFSECDNSFPYRNDRLSVFGQPLSVSSPGRIRTPTSRTRICGATITQPGKVDEKDTIIYRYSVSRNIPSFIHRVDSDDAASMVAVLLFQYSFSIRLETDFSAYSITVPYKLYTL